MFIASLTFALGAIVTAFAPHFGGFLVGRVICGLGGSGIVGITTILILDLVEEKRRGLCLGIMNSGFTFGVSVGAVLGGAGVGLIGWVSE